MVTIGSFWNGKTSVPLNILMFKEWIMEEQKCIMICTELWFISNQEWLDLQKLFINVPTGQPDQIYIFYTINLDATTILDRWLLVLWRIIVSLYIVSNMDLVSETLVECYDKPSPLRGSSHWNIVGEKLFILSCMMTFSSSCLCVTS